MLLQGSISVNQVVAQAPEGQASNGDVPQMSRSAVHQGRPQVQVEGKALTQWSPARRVLARDPCGFELDRPLAVRRRGV